MIRYFYKITLVGLIYFCCSNITTLFGQQFMMQGWYWDYPKTAQGASWADTLKSTLQDLKLNGLTHIWLPPHTISASGNNSNGYDPKDLFIGSQTSGFATRNALDALIQEMNNLNISPVADLVLNHRDGGKPEANPSVEGYVENYDNGKAENNENPFPSDRFFCVLPLGGASLNGSGDYYFKISSASGNGRFYNKSYKLYFQTKRKGFQNIPAINEVEPNGGGDCSQPNNDAQLGVDALCTVDTAGCKTDEFHINLQPSDYFESGDTLQIYLSNYGGGYSDHRIYGIWSSSRSADVVSELKYFTYTNFANMPSGRGAMDYRNFKPNGNPTGLNGNWDSMDFFYDYDQAVQNTKDTLYEWAKWNINGLGMKGFRLDAVKHFSPQFVGNMLNFLHASGADPNMCVGEWYGTNTSELSGWINDVKSHMNEETKVAIQPKIFDFSLRESLRKACDVFGEDARNIFNSSLNSNGLSGFNVVTFVNNHDFRDNSGFASLIQNDIILPYAYILTNNQLGIPCIYYPDYFGYYGNASSRAINPPLKPQLDQLIKAHKAYIYGASSVDYLNNFGSIYNTSFTSGFPSTTLIYQLHQTNDVVVAINFSGEEMDINQELNMTNITPGSAFTEVVGNSGDPTISNLNSNILKIKVPARSYAIWVEGEHEPIILSQNSIQLSAYLLKNEIKIVGKAVDIIQNFIITLEKSNDGIDFIDLATINSSDFFSSKKFEYFDAHPHTLNYYRLRVKTIDGAVTYSNVCQIKYNSNGKVSLKNNITSQYLEVETSENISFDYKIFDVSGNLKCIGTSIDRFKKIDVQNLVNGIYIIDFTSKNGKHNQKFIKK